MTKRNASIIIVFFFCFTVGCIRCDKHFSISDIEKDIKSNFVLSTWKLDEVSNDIKRYRVIGYNCSELNNNKNDFLAINFKNISVVSELREDPGYLILYFVPNSIELK